MTAKIGLGVEPRVPEDLLGKPVYGAIVGPYGITTSTPVASGDASALSPRPPLNERLGFDPNKTITDTVKNNVTYEPTLAEKMTGTARYWAYKDKTPEETQERIKAPFKAIGEFIENPDAVYDKFAPSFSERRRPGWYKSMLPSSPNTPFSVMGQGSRYSIKPWAFPHQEC